MENIIFIKLKLGEIVMKTEVIKDLCIGCELCPSIAPELYEMDGDGKAVSIKGSLNIEEVVEANEAAASCPVEAITVE